MPRPKNRRPTPPGEVFREDFLVPLEITQRDATERLRISYPRMNEIVNGKRAVTPDTALRLALFRDIIAGLNRPLNGDEFECCAVDLLRDAYPGIASIRGDQDDGMDGAIPQAGEAPLPLVSTTSEHGGPQCAAVLNTARFTISGARLAQN